MAGFMLVHAPGAADPVRLGAQPGRHIEAIPTGHRHMASAPPARVHTLLAARG